MFTNLAPEELLHHRFTTDEMQKHATDRLNSTGVEVAKFAVAGFVFSPKGEVLVAEHHARPGESGQGAIGTVSETLAYVDDSRTETPLEALKRCFRQEHGLDDGSLERAKLRLLGTRSVFFSEWGPVLQNRQRVTYSFVSLALRMEGDDVFEPAQAGQPVSDEIANRYFLAYKSAREHSNRRPGYRDALIDSYRRVAATFSWPDDVSTTVIDWSNVLTYPAENDARQPFTASQVQAVASS